MLGNTVLAIAAITAVITLALGVGVYYITSQDAGGTAIAAEATQNGISLYENNGEEMLVPVDDSTRQEQHRNRGGGQRGPGMGAMQCGGSPGVYIRELFANHDRFQFNYTFYDENMTLVWFITAETPELAETLASHIEQMKCILENGGTPRKYDPVFQLEAEMSPYIDTEVVVLNETTIKVVKTGENQCAYETIKLHAEVVEGFFKTGIEEARQIHPIPEDVLEICEPYLSEG
ncbi:MAG: hypothetical protein F7B18_08600 [Desulfurococcales archaeon]|nr:hypothetical protein [Desulfurococcales archaeon]